MSLRGCLCVCVRTIRARQWQQVRRGHDSPATSPTVDREDATKRFKRRREDDDEDNDGAQHRQHPSAQTPSNPAQPTNSPSPPPKPPASPQARRPNALGDTHSSSLVRQQVCTHTHARARAPAQNTKHKAQNTQHKQKHTHIRPRKLTRTQYMCSSELFTSLLPTASRLYDIVSRNHSLMPVSRVTLVIPGVAAP